MQETQARSPGQEDPLKKEMVTHSSTLTWEIPRTEAWRTTVHGVAQSQTQLKQLSMHTHTHTTTTTTTTTI